MKKSFVTLFPEVHSNDYFRDPCMIPFIMGKFYGYDSSLVIVNQNEDYSTFNKLQGLNLEKLSDYCQIKKYILENSKKIDVFNVFFLEMNRSLKWALWYKLFNKNGIVYVKLDMNKKQAMRLLEPDNLFAVLKRCLYRIILRKIDIVSTETTDVQKILQKALKRKIEYIPDGYYNFEAEQSETIAWEDKHNEILTVGSLGSEPKNSFLLLNAFANSKINKTYTLRLVGTRTEKFDEFIVRYLKKYPWLSNRIILEGPVYDRVRLAQLYENAKVFVLPSKWESFGIVLSEAASHGNYIISTNQVPAYTDISKDGKFGKSFDCEKENELIDIFDELPRSLIDFSSDAFRKWANEFNWIQIGEKIEGLVAEVEKK